MPIRLGGLGGRAGSSGAGGSSGACSMLLGLLELELELELEEVSEEELDERDESESEDTCSLHLLPRPRFARFFGRARCFQAFNSSSEEL